MLENKTVTTNDEEEICLDPNIGLKRVYDFLPYTHQRIKRIFKEDFGIRLDNIYQGYKANRREGYCELYNLVQIHDEQIVQRCLSLYDLRRFLANLDYPLTDDFSIGQEHRNKGAEKFLNIVEQLNNV